MNADSPARSGNRIQADLAHSGGSLLTPATRSPVTYKRRLLVALLPVLLPLITMIGTGLYGLDFGFHWDEQLLKNLVDWSIHNSTLLPRDFYNYPSMSYWLTLGGLAPEIVLDQIDGTLGADISAIASDQTTGMRTELRQAIQTERFHLNTRALFLLVSSSTILWVYLLVWFWRDSWPEAFLAAAISGLSWELAYHSRWMAPDAILASFGALTMLFVMLAYQRPQNRWWLRLAAVSAGLAAGTKYPAALFVVTVLLAGYIAWDRGTSLRGLATKLIEVVAYFGMAYLVTTPGTLLQPELFLQDVIFEMEHYVHGHIGHTVTGGLEHLGKNIEYFAFTFLSHHEVVSLALFGFTLLGVYTLIRQSRSAGLLFLSFPILYILLVSRQNVMIVRNLQVLVPFFAILSARGITWAWRRTRPRQLRAALGLMVASLLLANAAWLVIAAESIANRGPQRTIREASDYVAAHAQDRFFVSERVLADFGSLGSATPSNVTRDPDLPSDAALFYQSEGFEPVDWPTNIRNLNITWFGPWEVNLNYYSGWQGDDRILLMSMSRARQIGLLALD